MMGISLSQSPYSKGMYNRDNVELDRRRGEPSSAKFEIHMYLGIFFWRQAAL